MPSVRRIAGRRALACGTMLVALALAGCATSGSGGPGGVGARAESLANGFPLGRGADGRQCRLSFRWGDPAATSDFDRSYTIGCSGASAGRSVGVVTVRRGSSAEAATAAGCGAAAMVSLAGIGPVEARRCVDGAIGAEVVALRFARGGRQYHGAALQPLTGVLEVALRALAGAIPPPTDRFAETRASFDPAALAAAPMAAGDAVAGGGVTGGGEVFNPRAVLGSGLQLNRLGNYAETSRRLNDALSRLGPDTAPALRIEIALEAALADSNNGAFDAARDHLDFARGLIAANPADERIAFLRRKLAVYAGIDLVNQLRPVEALPLLAGDTAGTATAGGLEDPATLERLNRPDLGAKAAARALVRAGETVNDLRTLDIQADRMRSLALLGIRGRVDEAGTVIDEAGRKLDALAADVNDRRGLTWLAAAVERQKARVAARREDWTGALDHVDRAIGAIAQAAALGGVDGDPQLADARIDRAGYLARRAGPGDGDAALADYATAVDLLARSPGQAPSGIDRYLDLLVARGDDWAAERFFRAAQAIGTPAIARQFATIQSVVASDPAIGVSYRARLEAEQDLRRLGYAIGQAAAGTPVPGMPALDELRAQRVTVQAKVDALNVTLDNSRLARIDDSPATIAAVRAALLPGEVYFKLVSLPRSKTYAIAIGRDRVSFHAVEAPTATLQLIADQVRFSIDGTSELRQYDVAAAGALFGLIAGPVAPQLLAARQITVDPAGPLANLPIGVLVTSKASAERYLAQEGLARRDYSQVDFLARQADISTALSPRSFLVARALPEGRPSRRFLGLGQHRPPPAAVEARLAERVSGGRCPAGAELYEQLWNLRPISSRELDTAAAALGDRTASEITGAGFSDTAVMARRDLGRFAVLHFATHGIAEQRAGCAYAPPALITSIGTGGSDGLLGFDEIVQLDLGANLVVLSACDTASAVSERTARRTGQEGLAGLIGAFVAAKARAVIATQWSVPDGRQTQALMAAFYRSGVSRPIGEALRDGQMTLMRQPQYSHPYHWGAFFVVGDASKRMLAGLRPQSAALPVPPAP